MLHTDWIEHSPCLLSIGRFDHWICLVLPPDDEANRLRRTAAQIMRRLTAQGWGCALPDLSYYGENPFLNIDNYDFSSDRLLRDMVSRLCPDTARRARVSFRAGGQVAPDLPVLGHWCLSPPTDIKARVGCAQRTLRLHREPGTADLRVHGPPVWRWAEPGEDPAFTSMLSADIAAWLAQCVAS